MRSKLIAALIGAAALSVLGGGYAVAGPLITGKNVKNNSLTGRDVRNNSLTARDLKRGSLRFNRLSKGTQDLIRKAGTPGQNGASGAPGQNGTNGTNGTVGGAGGNFNPRWGIIQRNTIGSPNISPASGPFVGAAANEKPPFGNGSLGFLVKDNTEKASFGNQVDFAGQNPSAISQLGFRLFQTGESDDNAGDRRNLPNIAVEVDPNLSSTTSSFSTLVWNPGPLPTTDINKWSGYRSATTDGDFFLTGAAGTATNCTLATPCSFTEVKDALDDGGTAASILTVAVTKGRDNEWQGSIDGLRVNNDVFDFEVGGVQRRAP